MGLGYLGLLVEQEKVLEGTEVDRSKNILSFRIYFPSRRRAQFKILKLNMSVRFGI